MSDPRPWQRFLWMPAGMLLLSFCLLAGLWSGAQGYGLQDELDQRATHLRVENERLMRHNRRMLAEVQALREYPEQALEGLAREQLGMIRRGETFYFTESR